MKKLSSSTPNPNNSILHATLTTHSRSIQPPNRIKSRAFLTHHRPSNARNSPTATPIPHRRRSDPKTQSPRPSKHNLSHNQSSPLIYRTRSFNPLDPASRHTYKTSFRSVFASTNWQYGMVIETRIALPFRLTIYSWKYSSTHCPLHSVYDSVAPSDDPVGLIRGNEGKR